MRYFVITALAMSLAACGAPEDEREAQAMPGAIEESGEVSQWLYGGGNTHQKFAPFEEINRETVSQLQVAWTYDTGEDGQAGTMHSTPLAAGGMLYVAGPEAGIHALDPVTGEPEWIFNFPYPEETNTWFKGAPRGLMYWNVGGKARVFGIAGRYVFSVDAQTGELDEAFGQGGAINLAEGLGRDPAMVDAELGTPGVIHGDTMVLGTRMGEQLPTAPGHIRAYDVRTGEMKWIFHTIPQPGEYGYETWPEDAWLYAGGVNNWAGMALDKGRGIVYLGTGSAASDFYGADRHGENLFANSILALDVETGKRVWHRQLVKHDLWDRDIPAPPTLATLTIDGSAVDALIQITKSGHVWVLNRETGEALFPLEEVEVLPSRLPGEEVVSPQTLPVLPKPFARQDFVVTDRTPEARAAVEEQIAAFDPHHPFSPPSLAGQAIFPGMDGGGEWGGGAFDPETGYFYVNANEVPWILKMKENPDRSELGRASDLYGAMCATCHGMDKAGTGEFPSLEGLEARYGLADVEEIISSGYGRMPGFAAALEPEAITALAAHVLTGEDSAIDNDMVRDQPFDTRFVIDGYNKLLDPDGYPANAPPWGTLTAIDLATGEHVWRRPLGQYPELAADGMTDSGSENYGGPIVTAGGLVFIGATVKDKTFRAFDKTTGELLWSHELPQSGVGTPAVYEADGRQFVVTPAGGARRGERGSSYVAFALPQSEEEAAP